MADAIDTGQIHICLGSKEQVEELGKGSSFQNMDIECSNVSTGLNSTSILLSLEEHSPPSSLTFESNDDNSVERVEYFNGTLGSAQSVVVVDDLDNIKDACHSSKASVFASIEADPRIWLPPEPEDMENVIDSVTNIDEDDDDDYSDDTRWGQPSSLSNLDEEQGNIYNYKEERQKVMMDVMNGQLKILVSRCLASEGISFSEDDAGENWLDIVTSLSWEAALLVKPDDGEGRAMDPGSYVKVKCIASGSRSQSQVIKGLVFKKSAAHKHMPTKFRNAKLLLLKGCLGNSANGLSSFESMGKEKDHLKSTIDMIETCHPNVVLVEKTVSRDIQEALFSKGITLAFDMKLPRLERIALCTGSQIVSLEDITVRQNLKHCDSFRIEKFVEEHNSAGDAGKRLTKTLMFLEGCPRPLGCTILLKGASSDELKKIKHALHYTVFAAYHLKIETSFFADQKTFFSGMYSLREDDLIYADEMVTSVNYDDSLNSNCLAHKDSLACAPPANVVDIPIFDGSTIKPISGDQSNSSECAEGSLTLLGSSIESFGDNIIHKNDSDNSDILLGESLPALTSEPISSYFGLKENEHENDSSAVVCPLVETFDYRKHLNKKDHENPDSDFHNGGKAGHFSDLTQITEIQIDENTKDVKLQNKIDIESTLDPESILVLTSRQCIPKQIACEESRLSRIKYYGNFDVSLGRYLQDVLLSQKYTCPSCGERSEAHIYRFTHQNGILTAIVRLLPERSVLPGEAEGKIWMWTRCLKCDHDKGGPKASQRVVMSSVARGLSFGKFLDLSFADHSAANRLSRCGHLLHRDCLRFFGLGSKVAMFRYSSVEIYTACKPQPFLEFYNQNGQEGIRKEAKDILEKGELLYREVANVLQNLKPHFASSIQKQSVKFSGPMKPIYEIENMLKQDKTAFEASLQEVVNQGVHQGKNMNKILDLNWLIKELLFMLYVWDRRLHFLLQYVGDFSIDVSSVDLFQVPAIVGEPVLADGNQHTGNHGILENELKIESAQSSGELTPVCSNPYFFVEGNLHGEGSPELTSEEHSEMAADQDVFSRQETNGPEQRAKESCSGNENPIVSQQPYNSDAEDPEQWIWTPFSELRKAYRKDLNGGSLHKFQFINIYTPVHLSGVRKLITPECSLHFAVGSGGNVLSLVDDEISSIIACALALYKDQCGPVDVIAEKKVREELDQATDTSYRSHNSVALSQFPSTVSLESEGSRSSSSDELFSLASDASLFLDQLIASDNLHPEITLGPEKFAGKSKYSVICIYAKEFYSLRKKCCPSELAYICSLSRCKKWDAQGGKSKVFFAKTMDDRFIIKQIKKTELDSFLKFGPQYFKYLSFSLDSGSQTCLAKILGIYQVRQLRNGKEVKTDLMVMENLLFGRNISRKYDLKGAVFSRYVSTASDPDKVLLDENFIEDMRMSPIYVGRRTKHLLQRAIWNDTSFLTSINVMDYSLLVGVDTEHHELVFGIIDYVRQYTWDKQLETWVKSSLVVPKNALPTVVSPKEYKKRFRKFMSKYFLTVPDTWSCIQYSGSGKSFLTGDNCSSTFHLENVQDQPIESYA